MFPGQRVSEKFTFSWIPYSDIISEIKILNEIQICKVLRNQNAVIVKFASKNYWTLIIINILTTASTITIYKHQFNHTVIILRN